MKADLRSGSSAPGQPIGIEASALGPLCPLPAPQESDRQASQITGWRLWQHRGMQERLVGLETFPRLSTYFLRVYILMISNSKILFSEEKNLSRQLEQQALVVFGWSSAGLPKTDFKI